MAVKKQKKQRNNLKPAYFLIALGLLLIVSSIVLRINQETRLSFIGSYINVATKSNKVVPVKITIPKIDLTRPVYKTAIVNGTWQIAENGSSYLEKSSGIGEKNSMVVYDHNTEGKFIHLSTLKQGDTIIIEGSDKKIYVYRVKETKIVDLGNIKVLEEDKSENLILYTCYGFADLQRFIVKAVPSN